MNVLVPLLLIAVTVAFNALYVAAQFSTVGSRRSRAQEDADGGSAHLPQGCSRSLRIPGGSTTTSPPAVGLSGVSRERAAPVADRWRSGGAPPGAGW